MLEDFPDHRALRDGGDDPQRPLPWPTLRARKQGCVCGYKSGRVCQAERHGKKLSKVV